MTQRYGGQGGRGSRIVDDTPLTDGLIDFSKRSKQTTGEKKRRGERMLTGMGIGAGVGVSGDAALGAAIGHKLAPQAGISRAAGLGAGALGGLAGNVTHPVSAAIRHSPKALIGAGGGLAYHELKERKNRKANVGKTARYYDPEGRRQRRLGLAEAALLGTGGALAFRGGRGALKTTKLIRGATVTGESGGSIVPKKLLAVTRRDLAQLGGGATAIGAAGAVDYHGNHPRGRQWR